MLDQIQATTIKMKVKDVFSMTDTILAVEEWLEENGFVDTEGGTDYETVHTHAVRAGGNFLDVWLWRRAVRYPEGTTEDTSYLRYRLNVDMHFLGAATEVEMMVKGRKIKLNKGEVSFTITSYIEIDYRNEWKEEGILGLMNNVFKKKVYKKEISKHKDSIIADTNRFHNMLKQFFKLESTAPEETVSVPPKGILP